MAKGKQFYSVSRGYRPGIYVTWEECEQQVKGYSGARHKSFRSYVEAERFITEDGEVRCEERGEIDVRREINIERRGEGLVEPVAQRRETLMDHWRWNRAAKSAATSSAASCSSKLSIVSCLIVPLPDVVVRRHVWPAICRLQTKWERARSVATLRCVSRQWKLFVDAMDTLEEWYRECVEETSSRSSEFYDAVDLNVEGLAIWN